MYGYNVFHETLMTTLIDSVRNNENANTYIFEGEKGLAKHEAALLFAKALVCADTKNAPCMSCSLCGEAQAGSHPDILFINEQKGKSTIGVEPIRDMINESLTKPFYNRHKVFIINNGDILTAQAQNAFLKIIEEPPEYAVFIIITTSAQTLLETVRSRAVTVTFPPLPDKVVYDYIKGKYPDETRIDFLVKYCAGIPKYADEIIENEDFEAMREEVLNLVPRMLSKNKLHAFDVADYIDNHKDDAVRICDMMIMYMRDALVTASGKPDKVINSDKSEKINLLASKYPKRLLSLGIDEAVMTKKMLDKYVKASAAFLHACLCIK